MYRDRFSAFGFATHVVDGHSIAALESALNEANKQTDKPTVIICKTLKGKGFVEKIEGKMDWHGKDLGALQE